MKQDDLKTLLDVRAHLIALFDWLDAKNEPAALCKQSDVARELTQIIPKIDKILKDKVQFS